MNRDTHDGIFTSSLERAVRLGLLSLLACLFFYPAPAQGQVRRLTFTVKTGNDDLRGGNDNLNVIVNFRHGSEQLTPNVNKGQKDDASNVAFENSLISLGNGGSREG